MEGVLFVSVIGWSGSGKTTLIVRALEECRRRGIPAAAVKRARHEAHVAPEGKDSTLFLQAGASASLYVGDRSSARYELTPPVQDRAYFERLLPGASTVFMEGARVEGAIEVLVAGGARKPGELKRDPAGFDLLVTDDPGLAEGREGPAAIAPGDIGKFVDFVEAYRGS